MKKILFLIITFLIIVPVKAMDTSATSAILMDIDSGRILYSKDIHNVRSVASISKIMTAIIAIESGKLSDILKIGPEIEDAYGSGIYIKQGEHLNLENLVYGLMLRSGNDAALAIANYVGGSIPNFVSMMNNKAKELKMIDTTFNNPSGLDQDQGNYSTAYDMALLTSYAMKNDVYRKIVGTKNYKLETDMNVYSWTNKNKLLFSYKYATGGKTGYTEKARRTLVTTASKDNLDLTVVTLNDGDDFFDHKELYENIFENYKQYHILQSGEINILNETEYTNSMLYLKDDFYYPLLIDERENVILRFILNKHVTYKDDDEIGKVIVMMGDLEIHSQPIYIRHDESKKQSFWQKIISRFKK